MNQFQHMGEQKHSHSNQDPIPSFLKQTILSAHPSSPITCFYGNCQGENNNKVVFIKYIPSPPSEAPSIVLFLGITLAKKSSMKDKARYKILSMRSISSFSLPSSFSFLSPNQ